jgi:hypothetical protein
VKGHLIADRRTEILLGFGLFIGGAVLLRDAYDRRGIEQPVWMRPFSWW